MIAALVIPNADPNPLPAPYWVFKLLLVVTFYLHILAMNALLGGAALALLAKRRAGRWEAGERLFRDLVKKLPVFLPATITLGIAPLLFVQVLYGQFFYPASIILAWPWFLVLVLLAVAYYSFYYAVYRQGGRPGRAAWAVLVGLALVLAIGFVYTNVLTLAQTPARWAPKYFASPRGWHLNLAEPTLIPRYLHFITAAIAVGGLVLVLLAWANERRDPAYARSVLRFGGDTFINATVVQLVIGVWLLARLPRGLRGLFLGDSALATALLLVGVFGAVAAILTMVEALRRERARRAALGPAAITAVVILAMSWLRAILRDAYLQPYLRPEQFATETQWSVLPLFLAVFLAGVALWLLMLRRYGLLAAKGPDADGRS